MENWELGELGLMSVFSVSVEKSGEESRESVEILSYSLPINVYSV